MRRVGLPETRKSYTAPAAPRRQPRMPGPSRQHDERETPLLRFLRLKDALMRPDGQVIADRHRHPSANRFATPMIRTTRNERPPPARPHEQRPRSGEKKDSGDQPQHAEKRRDWLQLRQLGESERLRKAEQVNQAVHEENDRKDQRQSGSNSMEATPCRTNVEWLSGVVAKVKTAPRLPYSVSQRSYTGQLIT